MTKQTTWRRRSADQMEALVIPPIVHEVLRSPGQPLDPPTRAFMEPRFGHDFSLVRVHTDTQAMKSASAENALAYTVGHDVVFGPGQYAPHSQAGRHLIAHELSHVVQQTSGGVGGDAESRANVSAGRMLHGEAIGAGTTGGSSLSLQRAGKDDTPGASLPTSPATDSTEPPIDEFEFDKTAIPPQHLGRLAALRTSLINAPNASVVLTGHTDTVGTEKYNQDLGQRRAVAVRDFFTKQNGVNPSRIKIGSKGEMEPAVGQPPAKLDPSKGEKNPKNRRVEIRVEGLSPAAGKATQPTKGWTFDPADPKKKPPINLNLPPDYVPIPSAPKPGKDKPPSPSLSGGPNKGEGPGVEAAVVAGPGVVETTVEVTWESKSGLGRRLGSKISFTIHVGPTGLEQVESDLTVLKKKISEVTLGGMVRKLTFSLGLNPALNFDKTTAQRLADEFSVKAKASLEADLVIPKTSIKIPVEISESVDVHGKPEWEVKFKLFTW